MDPAVEMAEPAWRRPGPTAEQRRVDLYLGLIAVLGLMLSVTLANSTGFFALGPPPSWWEQLAWSVALGLPLVWRRRWPEATAVVVAVVFVAVRIRGLPDALISSVVLFSALYTVGAWGRDRRRARWLWIGIVVAMLLVLGVTIAVSLSDVPAGAFAGAVGPLPPVLAMVVNELLVNALFFLFAYLAGDTAWVAARRQHELRVQAEALLRSQETIAEQAVIRERVRIARELHDVVAHHVSVMGVQAGACRRVLERDPVTARSALTAIEETARTAVGELRRMLGVLREVDPGAPEATAPVLVDQPGGEGVDQIDGLLRAARDAGVAVQYGVFGTAVELPGSLSLAVYRVVQEAVTNTLKHAGARNLDVRIRYMARELEVDVADDGRGPAPAATPGGLGAAGGLGLIGMRERVNAHDGVLETGPRTTGGFRVRARFPLPAPIECADIEAPA